MTRWVSFATVLALLALASLGVVSAADGSQRVVGREPVNASFSTAASTPGIAVGTDEGALEVPGPVERVRFHVNWTPEGPQTSDLDVRFCESWCDAEAPTLAHTEGRGHLSVEFPVPRSGNVTWEMHTEEGVVSGSDHVEGVALYLESGPTPPPEVQDSQQGLPETHGDQETWRPGWGSVVVAVGFVGVSAVAPTVRRWWPSLIPIYHRSERGELLDHPRRAEIYELVEDRPGIHFSQIVEELDMGRGNLTQHLRQLEQGDLLVAENWGGYRCLFLPGSVPPDLRRCMAAAKAEGARQVVEALTEMEEASLTRLADQAELAVSTVNHHVRRLENAGAIESTRSGSKRRVNLSERGRRLARLLES